MLKSILMAALAALSLTILPTLAMAGGDLELNDGNGGVKTFSNVQCFGGNFDQQAGLRLDLSMDGGQSVHPVNLERVRKLDLSNDTSVKYKMIVVDQSGTQRQHNGVQVLGIANGNFYAIPEGQTKAFPIPAGAVVHFEALNVGTAVPKKNVWAAQLSQQAYMARNASYKPWSASDRQYSQELVQQFTNSPTGRNATGRDQGLVGAPLTNTKYIGPTGDVLDINDFKGDKNVLLVFMRGFPGYVCISCSSQTVALSQMAQEFEKRGTQIVVVFPGKPETVPLFLNAVRNLKSDTDLPFPVLYDVGLAAVSQMKITGDLAKPTSIIIDRNGVVRYAYVGESITDRPSTDVLIEQIDQLNNNV